MAVVPWVVLLWEMASGIGSAGADARRRRGGSTASPPGSSEKVFMGRSRFMATSRLSTQVAFTKAIGLKLTVEAAQNAGSTDQTKLNRRTHLR